MASRSTDSLTEAHGPGILEQPNGSTRLKLGLRLDASTIVQVTLKDVHPATYDESLRLTDILAGNLSGPPGKLFKEDVIGCLKTGGSAARIAVEESFLSETERDALKKLQHKLDLGKLFIAVVGSSTLVFCSSQNRQAGEKLGIANSLLGLADTLIVSQVAIDDLAAYSNQVMYVEELRLS